VTGFVLEVHPTIVELAQWCDTCALPSATRIKIAVVDAQSLKIVGRFTDLTICEGCSP